MLVYIKNKPKDGIKTRRVYFYGNSYNEQLMPIPAALISKRKDLEFNSFFTNNFIERKFKIQQTQIIYILTWIIHYNFF